MSLDYRVADWLTSYTLSGKLHVKGAVYTAASAEELAKLLSARDEFSRPYLVAAVAGEAQGKLTPKAEVEADLAGGKGKGKGKGGGKKGQITITHAPGASAEDDAGDDAGAGSDGGDDNPPETGAGDDTGGNAGGDAPAGDAPATGGVKV